MKRMVAVLLTLMLIVSNVASVFASTKELKVSRAVEKSIEEIIEKYNLEEYGVDKDNYKVISKDEISGTDFESNLVYSVEEFEALLEKQKKAPAHINLGITEIDHRGFMKDSSNIKVTQK